KDVSLSEVQSLAHLGELVRVRSSVVRPYTNSGGTGIYISGIKEDYRIFIPRARGKGYVSVSSIRLGETVQATGVARQYCPAPPFNTGFQLLAGSLNDIVPVEQLPTLPEPVIASGLTVILLGRFFLWAQYRPRGALRRRQGRR